MYDINTLNKINLLTQRDRVNGQTVYVRTRYAKALGPTIKAELIRKELDEAVARRAAANRPWE